MAVICCNPACSIRNVLPATATHCVVSPLYQPGVWNVVMAEPGRGEWCLVCAGTVAQQRQTAWQQARQKAPSSAET